MTYTIKFRRIGSADDLPYDHGKFSFAEDARRIAVRLNCKPYTPFFYWVEPTHNTTRES